MAISCTPSDLNEAAACYTCIAPDMRQAVKLYLLNQIAETGLTPEQLLDAARCYRCIPEGISKAVEATLLCLINGGTLPSASGDQVKFVANELSGTWVVPPLGNTDFLELHLPGLSLIDGGALQINSSTTLQKFSADSLTSIVNGELSMSSNSMLSTISLASLESISGLGLLSIGTSLGALTSFTVSSLTTIGGSAELDVIDTALTQVIIPLQSVSSGANIIIQSNPSLIILSLGNAVFAGPVTLDLNINAFNAASVNHVLARAVASPLFTGGGSIDLSGGTNSAPTGQGITDKATLIARGIIVTTN